MQEALLQGIFQGQIRIYTVLQFLIIGYGLRFIQTLGNGICKVGSIGREIRRIRSTPKWLRDGRFNQPIRPRRTITSPLLRKALMFGKVDATYSTSQYCITLSNPSRTPQ